MTVVIAYSACKVIGRHTRIGLAMVSILLIISGTYVYKSVNMSKAENVYHIPQEAVDICEMIKPGEVFKLAELLPYSEGKIINMDIVHNDKMKFVVMAFDEGTGLTEHAAPGEAIIFALDGEGIISYEGKDHVIKAGENFCFAKGGMHAVKASKRFKMALLLTLE